MSRVKHNLRVWSAEGRRSKIRRSCAGEIHAAPNMPGQQAASLTVVPVETSGTLGCTIEVLREPQQPNPGQQKLTGLEAASMGEGRDLARTGAVEGERRFAHRGHEFPKRVREWDSRTHARIWALAHSTAFAHATAPSHLRCVLFELAGFQGNGTEKWFIYNLYVLLLQHHLLTYDKRVNTV